jgi:flagellar protein FliS
MLYDGAILFCRQALMAMKRRDKVVQAEKISRTLAIICEFSNSLDHAIGGKLAEDLDAVYSYIIRELTRINIDDDRESLEKIEELLANLRETWVEAAGHYAKERQMLCETRGSSVAAVL